MSNVVRAAQSPGNVVWRQSVSPYVSDDGFVAILREQSDAENFMEVRVRALENHELLDIGGQFADIDRGVAAACECLRGYDLAVRRTHSLPPHQTRTVAGSRSKKSLPEALDGLIGSQHLLMRDFHSFKEITGNQIVYLNLGTLSQFMYHLMLLSKRCFEFGVRAQPFSAIDWHITSALITSPPTLSQHCPTSTSPVTRTAYPATICTSSIPF